MRVGIIAPPWMPVPPPAYGGTEEFVDELARGLQRAGHEVVLCTTGDSTCPVERRCIFERAYPDNIGNADVERRHVEHAYATLQDADVVHDNTLVGPRHARSIPGPPVVVTHHGPFDGASCTHYRDVEDRIALVAISKHQAATATGVRIESVIHHGLEPQRFPVGPGGGNYLMFLGRMTADKGAHRAVAVARATGMTLLLAGKNREPAEHAYFREHVEPLLGGNVRYLGEVPNEQKLALLGRATALLNPIQWPEPFGLNMIEALACGTPVLALASGSAPEIVEDGATGFVCRDDAEMAARVADVGRLERAACRDAVEHRFSTERMVRDYTRLFERLLARPSAA